MRCSDISYGILPPAKSDFALPTICPCLRAVVKGLWRCSSRADPEHEYTPPTSMDCRFHTVAVRFPVYLLYRRRQWSCPKRMVVSTCPHCFFGAGPMLPKQQFTAKSADDSEIVEEENEVAKTCHQNRKGDTRTHTRTRTHVKPHSTHTAVLPTCSVL